MSFEHYYTSNPTSALIFYEIKATLRDYKIVLQTSSGVFNPKKVDSASRLLIENMTVVPEQDFLDLGCGYGVIGIVAAKMGARVVFSDVNQRALMLVKKNLRLNKVKGEIIESDGFSKIDKMFDNITLNPPISAGMDTCHKLILESYNHLNKKGLLQLVARHNKGGSRLMNYMEEVFGNVEVVAKKAGFKTYLSIK